jgi:hypothetical protein
VAVAGRGILMTWEKDQSMSHVRQHDTYTMCCMAHLWDWVPVQTKSTEMQS